MPGMVVMRPDKNNSSMYTAVNTSEYEGGCEDI